MADDLTRIVRYLADTSKAVAEIDKLTKASDRAGTEMEGISKKLSDFGGMLKTAGVFLLVEESIRGAINGVRGLINELDDLSKTAQGIGLTTEQLSGLQYAADFAGVGAEQLTKSLVTLDEKIGNVAEGTDNASKILRSFGVTGGDDAATALDKIADAFSRAPDGATKTAFAVELFGKKLASQMIPLLNSGSAGIKSMTDEARRMGQVIGTDTAKQAEDFNDNLERLARNAKQTGIALVNYMLPALTKLSEKLVKNAQDFGLFEGAFVTFYETLFGTARSNLEDSLNVNLANMENIREKMRFVLSGGKTEEERAAIQRSKRYVDLQKQLDDLNKQTLKQASDLNHYLVLEAGASAKTTEQTKKLDSNLLKAGKTAEKTKDAFVEWQASVTTAMAAVDLAAPKVAYLEQLITALGDAGPEGAEKLKAVKQLLDQIKPPDALTKYVNTLEEAARAQLPVADQLDVLARRMIELQGGGEEAEKVIAALRKEYAKLLATTSTEAGVAEAIKQFQQAKTESEAWNAELARLVFNGEITGEVFKKLMKDTPQAFKNANDAAADLSKTIETSLLNATTNWTDSLIDGIGEADQSFTEFIENAIKSIAKLIVQKQVLAAFGSFFGTPAAAANGAAFNAPGVQFMARGGILTSPTFFTTARGPAVAAEAGPEAVVPLRRSSGGDLGVAASPVTINVQNYTEATVSQRTTDNADGSRVVDMLIERKVRALMTDGSLDRTMRASYGVTRQPG